MSLFLFVPQLFFAAKDSTVKHTPLRHVIFYFYFSQFCLFKQKVSQPGAASFHKNKLYDVIYQAETRCLRDLEA